MTTACDLAAWMRQELSRSAPNVDFLIRAIIKATDDWVRDGDNGDSFSAAPGSVGQETWDALLEGVVAYRANLLGVPRPEWTRTHELSIGWNPYDKTDHPPSPEYALLSVLDTPVEILDKGIILSQRNFDLT